MTPTAKYVTAAPIPPVAPNTTASMPTITTNALSIPTRCHILETLKSLSMSDNENSINDKAPINKIIKGTLAATLPNDDTGIFDNANMTRAIPPAKNNKFQIVSLTLSMSANVVSTPSTNTKPESAVMTMLIRPATAIKLRIVFGSIPPLLDIFFRMPMTTRIAVTIAPRAIPPCIKTVGSVDPRLLRTTDKTDTAAVIATIAAI